MVYYLLLAPISDPSEAGHGVRQDTGRGHPCSLRRLGEDLSSWRKLRDLTAAEVADRAGIGVNTVLRLERGNGATLENVLRVARALGVLDSLTTALDPYATDLGRLRADEALPQRVRHRRTP